MDSAKQERVAGILHDLGSVLVAFSGGVDSTLLLAVAVKELGRENVLAVTAVSESMASGELDEAERLAEELGADWESIRTHELDDPRYRENSRERCYFCKRRVFGRLVEIARQRGFNAVMDGANADDSGDWRPGERAARELGVRSPLKETGLTKAEVREWSGSLGLATAEKPAAACLASRIPYGTEVTREALAAVDTAERALRRLGFRELRVRHHGPVARIELGADELDRLRDTSLASDVASSVKDAGFPGVALDLAGFRSGSMNESAGDDIHGVEADRRLLTELGLPSSQIDTQPDMVTLTIPDEDISELWQQDRREKIVQAFRRRGFVHVAVVLT